MLTKRIIPCLDVQNGETVKGINFVNLRSAGDPVALGKRYSEEGADELVYLDISASIEGRKTFRELVSRVAQELNIPFTVGGGIKSIADISALLKAGADKVSVNTAAVVNPHLIDEAAKAFGSQCIVVAIDAKAVEKKWLLTIYGGREQSQINALEWAKELQERGAGEILLTSMDHDGTKNGFALELTAQMSEMLSIPVIASGGAGTMDHFADVFTIGKADAALAASVFHFREIPIPQLKKYLQEKQIPVRI
ncbi:MAG TPA: imidazole glycerol phosphate synthase subunit HisF [Candidatus Marinimicrobia bacterium]|nr:imidazole glycerol phosphate synthase subunit HisF [Candidatus Neomarinimicrobiota bacterium]